MRTTCASTWCVCRTRAREEVSRGAAQFELALRDVTAHIATLLADT